MPEISPENADPKIIVGLALLGAVAIVGAAGWETSSLLSTFAGGLHFDPGAVAEGAVGYLSYRFGKNLQNRAADLATAAGELDAERSTVPVVEEDPIFPRIRSQFLGNIALLGAGVLADVAVWHAPLVGSDLNMVVAAGAVGAGAFGGHKLWRGLRFARQMGRQNPRR